MSDRGYGYIKIGGAILEENIEELCHRITQEGANLGFDEFDKERDDLEELYYHGSLNPKTLAHLVKIAEVNNGLIVLSDTQACEGCFEHLEHFCVANKIDFNRHSDQLSFCSAQEVYFRLEHELIEANSNNDGTHLIHEEAVMAAIDLLEKHETVKALKHLKELITEVPDLRPVTFKMKDGTTITPKVEVLAAKESEHA